mmetsp:Transcript_22621/g.63043  ORF Transcript_22621/g.63043 Transcript_22621/m.63043 type:complete len:281 (-) Transcript_22621:79-921(-)
MHCHTANIGLAAARLGCRPFFRGALQAPRRRRPQRQRRSRPRCWSAHMLQLVWLQAEGLHQILRGICHGIHCRRKSWEPRIAILMDTAAAHTADKASMQWARGQRPQGTRRWTSLRLLPSQRGRRPKRHHCRVEPLGMVASETSAIFRGQPARYQRPLAPPLPTKALGTLRRWLAAARRVTASLRGARSASCADPHAPPRCKLDSERGLRKRVPKLMSQQTTHRRPPYAGQAAPSWSHVFRTLWPLTTPLLASRQCRTLAPKQLCLTGYQHDCPRTHRHD